MKTIRLGTWKTLLGLSILFFGGLQACCEKDPEPVPVRKCDKTGTLTRILCGASMYEDFYIRVNEKLYLQPCESDIAWKQQMEEGQYVSFGYELIPGQKHTSCDDQIRCGAIDERLLEPGVQVQRVRITCMELLRNHRQ